VVSLFADVIGHGQVTAMLADDVEKPAQAYLFTGPAGVGKATVARRFAALALCPQQHEDCLRRAVEGVHPDLVLVEPDGHTALTVERARETVARAVLTPVEADRKVFLFEEAGLMTDGAANALLKTLEEPTPSTVFVLVAESEDDLPATVASRCRTIVFGRVRDAEVVAALCERGVGSERAEQAAATSGGRPGLALMLATRPEVATYRRLWLSVPGRLSDRTGAAFRLASELVEAAGPLLSGLEERQEAERERSGGGRSIIERHDRERRRAAAALHVTGLEILASWYRDAAAAQYGASVRNEDVPATSFAAIVPSVAVERARRVLATVEALEANQRAELAFAALFADLAAPS
jgi:DNA polymerase-3 subunit delta'